MSSYYDGTKLLSLKDINGNRPEIFICTTNRTGGKTTYFNRLLVKRFLKADAEFMLLYRYNYELSDVAATFFKDIQGLFFPEYEMSMKARNKGLYTELFLKKSEPGNEPRTCGYAVSLNSADGLKRVSHLFDNVGAMLFDEFQSETGRYLPKEVSKLLSIHTSVARGNGKQTRYVPLYMLSNAVSLINPYYNALNISVRLNNHTKFLRGNGWVMEQGFIESAARAQRESGFNQAFSGESYVKYAAENLYLNDNAAFVESVKGANRYLVTLIYDNENYAVREFPQQGIIYVDDKPDMSYPYRISVTTEDHNTNYLMLTKNALFLSQMRYLFEHSAFRFKNLRCKEAVLKALSY